MTLPSEVHAYMVLGHPYKSVNDSIPRHVVVEQEAHKELSAMQ